MDEHAPGTPEGQAAWQACQSEGVWRHAGILSPLGGTLLCTGLDAVAAIALADPSGDLDGDMLARCLTSIEHGRLSGQAKQSENPDV